MIPVVGSIGTAGRLAYKYGDDVIDAAGASGSKIQPLALGLRERIDSFASYHGAVTYRVFDDWEEGVYSTLAASSRPECSIWQA